MPLEDNDLRRLTAAPGCVKLGFQAAATLVMAACLFFARPAAAHEPSKSYLTLMLGAGQFTGRWEIPLRDLQGLGLLAPAPDGSIAREQIDTHYPELAAYAFAHLQITFDGRVVAPKLADTKAILSDFSDGKYLQLNFALDTSPPPQALGIAYQLFFDTNSLHRGLLRLEADGKVQISAFSPEHAAQQFQLAAPAPGRQFLSFLREGIWHIWTGFDHILFLLALLLPAVLQREAGQWQAISTLRSAFFNVLKIVTAFTVAHSLTLSLAMLGMVRLPTRLTESAIAVSVALAAANNLWPLIRERGWMVAFGFGLVHGFGFATALSDLGLAGGSLALTLIGFNLGVEIGQLAIVATFLPLAFCLRGTWMYQGPVLRFGSAFIILLASAWCVERVAGVNFMPI